MILPLLAIAAIQAGPVDSVDARYDRCVALIGKDPAAARAEAARWRIAGGRWFARACAGLAFAKESNFAAAATEFEEAARAAELGHDDRTAGYWAQAGNAWLAAGNPARARTALDAALAGGTLKGLQLGEAQLDHARALVATGDMAAARTDLDRALANAPEDPLAWLLSATLARRMGSMVRAKTDIAEALKRASDDASVQLEAGNIAATLRDETGAKSAWAQAVRIAPDSEAGRHAAAALQQFAVPAK